MDWTSAPNTVDGPLEPARSSFLAQRFSAVSGHIEQFLEVECAQLPLWFAVAFGTGIAAWLCLAGEREWAAFLAIAMADRRLPRACLPRWLKLDRPMLERTGGLVIYLDGTPRVSTVADRNGRHPWKLDQTVRLPTKLPARQPARYRTDR